MFTKIVTSSLLIFLAMTSSAQLSAEDEKVFKDLMEEYHIPGMSVAIVDNFEIVYAKGFGVKSSKSQEAIDINTPFQAASLSKSIASVLSLRLAEKGLIELDDSINDYLKDWQLGGHKDASSEIPTFRQLLSHTGGTNASGFLGYRSTNKKIPSIEMVLENNKDAHSWEKKVEMIYPPKLKYQYSGGGYCIVQKAINDTSGERFQDLVKQEVLGPLKMHSSFIDLNLTEEQESLVSHGHNKKGKVIKGNYHVYPELAAAGLWTTPSDLSKMLLMMMNSVKGVEGDFLSNESVHEMIDIQPLSDGGRSWYGLGIGIQPNEDGIAKIISHSGSNWGFGCKMYANVKTGKAIVVMINRHYTSLEPFTDVMMERINFLD